MRARIRWEASHEKPATAGLSCRELVSEVKSRSLQGVLCKSGVAGAQPAQSRAGLLFSSSPCVNPARSALLRGLAKHQRFVLDMISIAGRPLGPHIDN